MFWNRLRIARVCAIVSNFVSLCTIFWIFQYFMLLSQKDSNRVMYLWDGLSGANTIFYYAVCKLFSGKRVLVSSATGLWALTTQAQDKKWSAGYLNICLYPSFSLPLCFTLSLSLSLSVSVYLSVSIYTEHTHWPLPIHRSTKHG